MGGRSKGSKTTPLKTQEKILAYFETCLRFDLTAEHFGIPYTTAYAIVKRLAGDRFEALRDESRAVLIAEARDAVRRLLPLVKPEQLGQTDRVSTGSEAARAFADVGRVLTAMEPPQDGDTKGAATIIVKRGFAVVQADEQVTQTAATDTSSSVQAEAQDSTLTKQGQ